MTTKVSPSKRDRPPGGSGNSGGGGTTPFFGRQSELGQFETELRDPRGSAILVVGHRGMGKTMLLHRFIALAGQIDGLQCGAVREEVTPSDTVETVLGIFMDRAYEAASITEGSGEPTPRRLKQWRALLNVVQIGDLVMSLRRDPKRNTREQFLGALERIAAKLPANGRAVFIIDPEKYLPPDCDQDWAIVIRRLPDRIKFVFAQRPDDALADSAVIIELQNIARIPDCTLDVLDKRGFEDLVDNRAVEIGMTSGQLKEVLAPYGRHPYAVVAAIDLLAAGVSPDQLPNEPKPTEFATAQWKQIQRGGQSGANGELAIPLFQAYALLEVPVPDDLVEEVSGLSSAQRLSLTADSFLGPLLRDEAGLQRIYHAILSDDILSVIPEKEATTLHQKAINAYRQRLNAMPPDRLAARRLALHVRAVEGDGAFVTCFVNECNPKLRQLGLLDEIEALIAQALPTVKTDSEAQAALFGNLGNVMKTRGDLDGAEAMHRKSLEIDEKLGRLEGMANDYGNLGVVMQTRGDLDGAEAMFRKALEIYEKLGRLVGMAQTYGNLGTVVQIRGDLDGAEAMLRKALEIDEKLGRLEGMAIQCGNLGNVMKIRGDLDAARELWTKSRDLFAKLGAQHMVDKVQGWIDELPG